MAADDEDRRLWFRHHVVPLEPMLLAYATRLCRGGPDEAEDLVHDTFAKLIVYAGWRNISSAKAFALSVMKNTVLYAARRRKIVSIHLSADLDALHLADTSPGADRVLEARDELRQLAGFIHDLPPKCRQVFILRKVYGLSHAAIADRLGLSISTVEKHVIKGLRHCSERMAADVSPPTRQEQEPRSSQVEYGRVSTKAKDKG